MESRRVEHENAAGMLLVGFVRGAWESDRLDRCPQARQIELTTTRECILPGSESVQSEDAVANMELALRALE